MRPHTRTRVQEGGSSHCLECCKPGDNAGRTITSTTAIDGFGEDNQHSNDGNCHDIRGSNGSNSNNVPADPDALLFAVPQAFNVTSSWTSSSANFVSRTFSSNMSSVSNAPSPDRDILLVELPAEVLVKIIGYLPFKTISEIRMVSFKQ